MSPFCRRCFPSSPKPMTEYGTSKLRVTGGKKYFRNSAPNLFFCPTIITWNQRKVSITSWFWVETTQKLEKSCTLKDGIWKFCSFQAKNHGSRYQTVCFPGTYLSWWPINCVKRILARFLVVVQPISTIYEVYFQFLVSFWFYRKKTKFCTYLIQ